MRIPSGSELSVTMGRIAAVLVAAGIAATAWWAPLLIHADDLGHHQMELTHSGLALLAGILAFGLVDQLRRARRAVRQSRADEARFRSLFEGTFQFIGMLSPEGILLDANRAALELIGGDLSTLRGRPFWDTPWWSHSPQLQDLLKRKVGEAAAGTLVRFDATHRRVDGGEVIVDVSIKPLTDAAGRVTMLIPEGRDITEMREREAEFHVIMEATTVGIFSISELRFRYVNTALAEMLGYRPEELIGLGPPDIVVPAQREVVRANTIRRAEGEPGHPYQIRCLRKDGSEFDGLVWSNRVTHRGRPATIGSLIDISDRVRAEEKLHMAIDCLAQSNAELERFAYVASHDLQEPLRTITSFAQLIERRQGELLDDEGREFLAFIVKGAKRMHALVNDLLTYSRVTTAGAPFAPVAPEPVIARVLEDLRHSITQAEATIEVGPMPAVIGDETQLGQLFLNLISNAIKFRHPGAQPIIHVTAERDGEDIRVTVADNGIGIPADYSSQLFTVFRRLHGEAYPGTGIGLAICKRIVDRHGGRIWIEPGGDGATIRFTLKAAPG